MEKINSIINDYKSEQKSFSENKNEIIQQLLSLRKRAIRLVENANKTLSKRNGELQAINETICEIRGHIYTDWEEHDGFLDRTWYYTRQCEFCGIKEKVDDEPFEYRAQMLKKRKTKE